MEIYAISFNSPRRQPSLEATNKTIEYFPNFIDESMESCDDVGEKRFINIAWGISGKRNIIKSTVIIKGSQQCHASNTAWFISERVPGSMVIGCDVTEEQSKDLRKCKLRCQCACRGACGFLHFRVQIQPWMKKNLSLCHYEEYYYLPYYQ